MAMRPLHSVPSVHSFYSVHDGLDSLEQQFCRGSCLS
jgi:hypothetical protein